jgi:hypothetical protein
VEIETLHTETLQGKKQTFDKNGIDRSRVTCNTPCRCSEVHVEIETLHTETLQGKKQTFDKNGIDKSRVTCNTPCRCSENLYLLLFFFAR